MRSIYFISLLFFISCSKSNLKKSEIDLLFETDSISNFSLKKNKAIQLGERLYIQKNDSTNREHIFKIANLFFQMRELQYFKNTSLILNCKAHEKNDSFQLANSYMLLGNYYQEMSVNDSSFFYYSKAEKLYEKLKNDKRLATIYYLKALTLYYCNDFLGSETLLIKSLRISKKINFFEKVFDIYVLIAANSYEQKDYVKSIEYNNLALDLIAKKNMSDEYRSIAYVNMGSAYLKMGNNHEAIKKFNSAFEQKKLIIFDPSLYALNLDNLAYAQFKLKNYTQLPNLYHKAAKIRDSLHIEQGQNYNRMYLSEFYAAVKDTAKASFYAHQAYSLSQKFKAPGDMLNALKQLSAIEPKNALRYSKDYIRISDSIYQLERETRNKFAKIAYETEEITNEKNTAITHKSIFFGIAIAVSVVGLLIFIIIYQKNKHKEMHFLQQQQKSNDEIYQLIQTQHQKIEEGRFTEKLRIAQDLHDGIMNKLASTRFNLHLLTQKNDPEAFEKCAPYINGIQDIEIEIRNIAHDLNNQVFAKNNSFKNTLLSLFDEQQRIFPANWHIEFDSQINWENLKSNVKIHVFRMFQELLQNISKHSLAKNVIVSAAIKKELLFLEVYDDGQGFFLKQKKKGIGLQNIYARVKQCDGSIKILSNKGQGTKVIIKIPLHQELKII